MCPFQRKIHAIFPGHTFKGLDISVGHFDIGNTRALPDKVLHTLFAPIDFRVFLAFSISARALVMAFFQQISGQLSRFDADCHGLSFHFFLHLGHSSFPAGWKWKRGTTKVAPPADATGSASASGDYQQPSSWPWLLIFRIPSNVVAVMPRRCATAISFLRLRPLPRRRQSGHGCDAAVPAPYQSRPCVRRGLYHSENAADTGLGKSGVKPAR